MPIDYTKRPNQAEPGPGVSLSKVTLTKQAPSVSLTKHGATGGVLRVNLNWQTGAPTTGGGFLKRLTSAAKGGVDLDLACLYEFSDGSKGVVQALGNAFRSKNEAIAPEPIVWLDADDRTGTAVGGENMFINLAYQHLIRRVLVFAFIYEGAPNWAAANGIATLFPVAGPQIEVLLDEGNPNTRFCAIALLQNQGGELTVQREVRYIEGTQRHVDAAYGWGLNWAPGRK